MTIRERMQLWLGKLGPEIVAAPRRFPLAILFALAATVVLVASIARFIDGGQDVFGKIWFGCATGFFLAVAGRLIWESRPGVVGLLLALPLPFVPLLVFYFHDFTWQLNLSLLFAVLMWGTVSPFTQIGRGEERKLNQRRFWWFNHRAVSGGIIAGVHFLVIALGIAAIERSLAGLFGVETQEIFYRWVLPIIGCFFTPLYWLAIIPRLEEYDDDCMTVQPDFTAQSVGFLGQFVLTPLLIIYSLILLAYTAQIVITQNMPPSTIGWMVLGYFVVGTLTWLLLYPPFMQKGGLSRFYRNAWFWLTIVPIGLYAVAVYIRVDAYGLTSRRIFLIAGGVWAISLTIAYLARRGDIRLMPALAGVALLAISFGPLSATGLAEADQADRFEEGLRVARFGEPGGPDWSGDNLAMSRSALTYLVYDTDGDRLRAILDRHDIPHDQHSPYLYEVMSGFKMPDGSETDALRPATISIYPSRDMNVPVDVSPTPFFYNRISLWWDSKGQIADLALHLKHRSLVINRDDATETPITEVELGPWLDRQPDNTLVDPYFDFSVDGTIYRLVIDSATINVEKDSNRTFYSLEALLFRSAVTEPGADTPEAEETAPPATP